MASMQMGAAAPTHRLNAASDVPGFRSHWPPWASDGTYVLYDFVRTEAHPMFCRPVRRHLVARYASTIM